ncbi:MAG: hypothetical protein WDM79_19230 [Terricaulis sp.]
MRRDRCPIGVLRHALPRWNAQGALWPAHNFLSWLLAYAARGIELGCPCCGRVSDDEALMLAALFAGDRTQAQAALADARRIGRARRRRAPRAHAGRRVQRG